MHYVYVIYSESCGIYYKGETENPLKRLEAHNKNLSEYTRNKGPWVLIFLEEHPDRKAALKREKQIKRLNARSLYKLFESESNIISTLLGRIPPCHVSSRHS
jgi:putative endonuclease